MIPIRVMPIIRQIYNLPFRYALRQLFQGVVYEELDAYAKSRMIQITCGSLSIAF